ncbi:hypothetical protein [Streptomyces formicae]|uniref:Uncharacterized protein n=1 Tax=Streptomyces formicae TaxID=1616117 RepID=A0ABY3WW76_9ACTN|nr:hypothetical protein [Streptomyces formicae]UNM16923.1 hypothetical protein J4032_32255 [Streptomyces formicae]
MPTRTVFPELPPLRGLSEWQFRGRDCVFCGITLAPGNAVDLGPRRYWRGGQPCNWFPRACKKHAEGSTS